MIHLKVQTDTVHLTVPDTKGLVNVPLDVTENGTYVAPVGNGYSPVTVNVEGVRPTGEIDINENGVFNVTDFASANVNVPTSVTPYTIPSDKIVEVTVTQKDRPILPDGYTHVEYIRANGTQYINTGVIANSPRTAQFEIEFMSRGVTQTPCGAQKNNANAIVFASIYYFGLTFSYGGSSTSLGNLTANKKYSFAVIMRNGYQQLSIDDASQGQTTKAGEMVNDIPFYLFANNNNGTPTGLCDARIYRCIIRNGNQLTSPKVCDLVPCREESTGKYGMYDLVSNTFLENQGTGDFEGGAEVQNLNVNIDGFNTQGEALVSDNINDIFD